MHSIDIVNYPKNISWDKKINSTPSIPGGKNVLLKNLRQLLLLIKNKEDLNKIPELENSSGKSTIKDLCIHQLGPMNFIERQNDGNWILSKEAELWLQSEDDLYLAAFFCANTKFFGEILFYLDTPKTSRELFDIAVNNYDMAWKTNTTINNRLVWLRQFNLIEFQEYSLLYNITDKGKEFLKTIHPIIPEALFHNRDETINENDIGISDSVIEYYKSNSNNVRKKGLGYLPGNINYITKAISDILLIIKNEIKIEKIKIAISEIYKIKDSSIISVFNTLISLGLIERTSNTEYSITDIGETWLCDSDILFLLPLFQIRYLFFMEILTELKDCTKTSVELAAIAKIKYGFDRENTNEINKRLVILKQAKLVMNVSAEKFSITNRGILFIEKYGTLFKLQSTNTDKDLTPKINTTDIISELRIASKDSFNPNRFEKDVCEYFNIIGFDAEWLGGPGKTDVLLKTSGSPFDSFVVTIDTKSTQSSAVTDSLVDFDTLKEHQKKHNSDYIAIVGRDFNDRIINRAKEHEVALFDLDSLEKLLLIHQETPLKISKYRKIFKQSGKVDLTVLDKDISRIENECNLLIEIMKLLITESTDVFTRGKLSVRDLYMSLRNSFNGNVILNVNDIETALDFLASPIIDCVGKEKEFYFAKASFADFGNILNYIKRKCI